MRKPRNRVARANNGAPIKDTAANRAVTASIDTDTDSDVPQEPLYAFARLVAGHDRAESWLTQEREKRSRIQSNLSSIDSAPSLSHNQPKPPRDESYDARVLENQNNDQPVNEPNISEYKSKSSTRSLLHPKNNNIANILPAKEYLEKLGYDVDLRGHPFLHNRKSWPENCSILHNKVMELYRSAGCWTKHPWNKDNCTEDTYSTLPYPFSIPFTDRPSHNSHVQGSEKPQQTCLTCINAKRGCGPGSVMEGKCLVCQGGYAMTNEAIRKGEIRYEDAYDENDQPKRPKMGGKFSGGKQRTCYWEIPEYFINTYEVAHLFFGGRYRTNKADQSKSKVILKLTQPLLDSLSQLQTDRSVTPFKHDVNPTQDHAPSTVSNSPDTPEPVSRLNDSSSPSSIFQSSSPQHAYPSSATSIHQHSHLNSSQTLPDEELWSNDGFPNFDMANMASLVSDGSKFPSATGFAPLITFNGKCVETIDPRLLHYDTSMLSTDDNPASIESVVDSALLNSEIPIHLTEHTMNEFDIEFDRLEELNRLSQPDMQELVPPLPVLTTDAMDTDKLLEDFQPLQHLEDNIEEAEATNTFFDFDAWSKQNTQSENRS